MKISSLIGHLNELYSLLSKWEKPADNIIKDFYKSRRYLGSKDRKFISNNIYSIIRNDRLIRHIKKALFPDIDDSQGNDRIVFVNHILSGKQDELLSGYFAESITNYSKVVSLIERENELLSDDPFLRFSFPAWMKTKIEKVVCQKEIEQFLSSLNQSAPVSIRLIDNNKKSELLEEFNSKGVSFSKNRLAPNAFRIDKRVVFTEMKSFIKGDFEVQDEGSQLVTLFTGAKGDMNILDACAGGGGKSLYLSNLINESGEVFAFDSDIRRLEMLKKRVKGKNYHNIKIIDSARGLNQLEEKCDIVVLDAPCSGSGTLRRNPDLKWRLKENDISLFAEKQLQILKNYSKYVKKGGDIVYITCSFFMEENEEVIMQFLSTEKEFSFDNGLEFFQKYDIEPTGKFLRLYPHKHDTDGFTACRLKKNF